MDAQLACLPAAAFLLLLLVLILVLILEPPLLHDAEVVQHLVPPLPLLFSLLSSERAVPGQWREIIPVVHGEGLEGPVGALGEDVVGRVLCHASLLDALELPARFAVDPEQPGLVLGPELLEDDAVLFPPSLLPKLAVELTARARFGHLLLLVDFLVAQVPLQPSLIPRSKVDFIGCIKSHDVIFLVVFLGTRTTYSVTFWLLGPRAAMGNGQWFRSGLTRVPFVSSGVRVPRSLGSRRSLSGLCP